MTYLADKSALARIAVPAVGERLLALIGMDLIVTCGMVDLEVLYSARNSEAYEALLLGQQGFGRVPLTDDVFNQAIAIQRALAEIGKHRRPIPDLIIAAAALLAGVTVLHYDNDFEIIAEVCDLHHEWVAPKGSL